MDEVLIDLSLKSDDIQPLLQKVLLALWMILQIVFHTEFSHQPGSLGRLADRNSIPWSQTTTFHPILIEATLLKYLLLLFEQLFQRYKLSRFDEVMDLHMLSQIPTSGRCIQLLVSATAPRRILTTFSPSHVKSSFLHGKDWIHWVACNTTA